MKNVLLVVVLGLGLVARAQDAAAVERFNALPEAQKQALREKLTAF